MRSFEEDGLPGTGKEEDASLDSKPRAVNVDLTPSPPRPTGSWSDGAPSLCSSLGAFLHALTVPGPDGKNRLRRGEIPCLTPCVTGSLPESLPR